MEFDILSWIVGALSFIIGIISYIKSALAKLKLNKVQKVLDNVYGWCIQAEELFKRVESSGGLKLQTVLDNALRFCVATKTKYDEESVKNEIEKVITCSKFINARNEIKPQQGETQAQPQTFCEHTTVADSTNFEVNTTDIKTFEELEIEPLCYSCETGETGKLGIEEKTIINNEPIINNGFLDDITKVIEPTTDTVNKIFLGGGKQ